VVLRGGNGEQDRVANPGQNRRQYLGVLVSSNSFNPALSKDVEGQSRSPSVAMIKLIANRLA
jgi:hypothetical protein